MTATSKVMKDHEYFVYIMSSRSGTLYIGSNERVIHRRAGSIE